jgi:hypothetical protein
MPLSILVTSLKGRIERPREGVTRYTGTMSTDSPTFHMKMNRQLQMGKWNEDAIVTFGARA